MRSLTFPQNSANNSALLNLSYNMDPAYLTSYYMNMFDPFKSDSTLLGKRSMVPYATNTPQEDPQKRLRTSLFPNGFINSYFQQSMMNTIPQQMIPVCDSSQREILVKSEGTKQEENFSYSSTYQSENNQAHYFQDEEVRVKEEYLKIEESAIKQEASDSFQSVVADNENNKDISCQPDLQLDLCNIKIQNENKDELSLADLTKVYPDWDLVTIFRHIENDKPTVPSGISQRIKLRRKMIKQEPVIKEWKTQEIKECDEDYRPGKSINVKFRQTQAKKNNIIPKKKIEKRKPLRKDL